MTPVREGFRCPVTVEFEDVDGYGIAHHSRLVCYLERARVRFIRSLGLDLEPGETFPVLHDLRVRFAKPVRLLEQLEVAVFVESVSDYRLELGYRIRRGDETVLRASTTIAFADRVAGTLVAAPQVYVDALAAALRTDQDRLP
jgi:YbgC/YbaW family acyl-CoA thioester hydrolase